MKGNKKSAFLFPGNDVDYRKALKKIRDNDKFLEKIRKAGTNIHAYMNSELYNMMMIYIISCTISDIYKTKNIFPELVSGYCIGMYSSLYTAEAYTFETGLSIVRETFKLVSSFYDQKEQDYGMGVIIGLTENEIIELLFENTGDLLEIACINSDRNIVIVGEIKTLKEGLKRAKKLGAFKTIPLKTGFGYHTSQLKDISEKFRIFLKKCEIFEPRYKILSPLDMNIVDKDTIIPLLVKNLYSPIHWKSLINTMITEHNIWKGYEAGPGESLAKMSKYINRDFKVYTY